MDFKIPISEAQMEQRFLQIEKLRQNQVIQNFLRSHNLPFSIVEKNSSLFLAYLERLSLCKGCQGLDYCRQPLKGRIQILSVDNLGYLSDIYRPCKFEKLYDQTFAHQKNFKMHNGSQKQFLIDFDTIDLEKESDEYIQVYMAMIDSLDQKKGIYLYGQPGTGKTYLLWALANRLAKEGKTISFVHLPSLIQDLKQNMQDNLYRNARLSKMKYCDVLIIDDIGAESISPWTRDEILFPILEFRMSQQKKTYFSSNYSMEELEDQYAKTKETNVLVAAQRLLERIKTLAIASPLYGASRR